ncbi:ATP-grasp domain-containing protein [Georgenia sp. SUBG003]|uniref:ATP-grasp domain-containing protein n=1 Tax=Georgenia sp. SUBG003 TaxID=1497974 RepID=UPI003AB2F764
MSYPVWVKPVKSSSSEGASYAADEAQLQAAVARARATLDRIGPAWEELLAMVELPPEIAAAGARTCLVEEAVTGHQFTVEGYGRAGRVRTYGVVDSFRYPGSSSFLRYQYPSVVPERVQEETAKVTEKVITAVGLESSTFNIEYFWDAEADRLSLLEINTRHSQSHAMLFTLVDGVPNHACMVALALGREPRLPRGAGPHRTAAKWFLRRFTDGVVRRVPTPDEIAALERAVPGTTVRPAVAVGDRLSRADGEDSYSFVLAEIYTGGDDEDELAAKYAACVEALCFQVDDVGEGP